MRKPEQFRPAEEISGEMVKKERSKSAKDESRRSSEGDGGFLKEVARAAVSYDIESMGLDSDEGDGGFLKELVREKVAYEIESMGLESDENLQEFLKKTERGRAELERESRECSANLKSLEEATEDLQGESSPQEQFVMTKINSFLVRAAFEVAPGASALLGASFVSDIYPNLALAFVAVGITYTATGLVFQGLKSLGRYWLSENSSKREAQESASEMSGGARRFFGITTEGEAKSQDKHYRPIGTSE